MTRRRRLFSLFASAAAHAAAIALPLMAVGVMADSPLIVDLVADRVGEGGARAALRGPSPGPTSPLQRSTRTAPAPSAARDAAPGAFAAAGPGIAPGPSLPEDRLPSQAPSAAPAMSSVPVAQAPPDLRLAVRLDGEAATLGSPQAAIGRPEGTAPGGAPIAMVGDEGRAVRGPGGGEGVQARAGGGRPTSAVGLSGGGDGQARVPPEYGPFLEQFRRRVQEMVEYPLSARRRGLSGQVELEVELAPSGRVQRVDVVTSSSHEALDEAALDAVRSLRPEPLPANLPRRPLRIRLPLTFTLK